MTSVHAILVLIIRLWAAQAVINVLIYLPSNLSLLNANPQSDDYSFIVLGQTSIWLMVGIAAWFVAPWLAQRVSGKSFAPDAFPIVDTSALIAVGSSLIGLFYLVEYAPPILVDWFLWLIRRAGETPMEQGQLGTLNRNGFVWNELISNLLVVFVALVMAIRPVYVARVFNWLRSAGHSKEAESQT